MSGVSEGLLKVVASQVSSRASVVITISKTERNNNPSVIFLPKRAEHTMFTVLLCQIIQPE